MAVFELKGGHSGGVLRHVVTFTADLDGDISNVDPCAMVTVLEDHGFDSDRPVHFNIPVGVLLDVCEALAPLLRARLKEKHRTRHGSAAP